MKGVFTTTVKIMFLALLCAGLLVSCDDDNNATVTSSIGSADPSQGFLVNSTGYSLSIDLGEKETFDIRLAPGQMLAMQLQAQNTYTIHVIILDGLGRVISEYNYNFYIDDVPLDNKLRDFMCSWYVEFTPVLSGFANRFGT